MLRIRYALLTVLLFALIGSSVATSEAADCPPFGWAEGLIAYTNADRAMPYEDTKLGSKDCIFQEWSWETFVWATALDKDGVPRFLTLPTPAEIFAPRNKTDKPSARTLRLSSRSILPHPRTGFTEGAGAIVEADGNMMVAKNGYPIYASVHMNQSYFNTVKKNMIADGGYLKNLKSDTYFDVGAGVFKATWLRLAPGESAPKGTFTTVAEVPYLIVFKGNAIPTGQFRKVIVALVGLHVVGYTVNHPEFVWATFEHKLNSPRTPDNTFSPEGSSPNNYTFYKANTPYSEVNLKTNTHPAKLTYHPYSQTFSPTTNAVQKNKTGGNIQPDGVKDIAAVNAQGQGFLSGQKGPQSIFANYDLIGTVWMKPDTYSLNSDAADALGSVTLANSTAETFVQSDKNSPLDKVKNCFMCHNAGSYNFQPFSPLPKRRIAISHVLGEGSRFAVPNTIPVKDPAEYQYLPPTK